MEHKRYTSPNCLFLLLYLPHYNGFVFFYWWGLFLHIKVGGRRGGEFGILKWEVQLGSISLGGENLYGKSDIKILNI